MKFRKIKRNDIESLIPLFAKNYTEVTLKDELEYFDEECPNDWVLAEENGKILGYIRHFPDHKNDFAPIEYFLEGEDSLHKMFNYYFEQVNPSLNIRLQLPLDKEKQFEFLKAQLTKEKTFLCYEIKLNSLPVKDIKGTDLSKNEDIDDLLEALRPLGNYEDKNIKNWIDKERVLSYKYNNKIIGVCYFHSGKACEIEMISIVKDFQGNGLGTAFLLETLSFFKTMNVDKVFLKVSKSNIPAISLYQKCNFLLNMSKSEIWLYKR